MLTSLLSQNPENKHDSHTCIYTAEIGRQPCKLEIAGSNPTQVSSALFFEIS